MALSEYATSQLDTMIIAVLDDSRAKLIETTRKTSAIYDWFLGYSQHVYAWQRYVYAQELAAIAAEYGAAVDVGPTPYDCDC